MAVLTAALNKCVGILWGWYTPFIILGVSLYFTIRTRAVQWRRLKDMFALLKGNNQSTENGISGLQSWMISAAGRVGVGNIAGVATAICFGGPGSIPWMCIGALLGAATAFIECTLANIYKVQYSEDELRGGTHYYIEKGLNAHWLAMIFGFFAVLAESFSLLLPNMLTIKTATAMVVKTPAIVPTLIVAAVFCLIVFGGVHRIADFANKAVPFMSLVYVATCLVILIMNVKEIPGTFALMFKSAFDPHSIFGAIIGSAVLWGVKRGIYSNEAGHGTATTAAGAADVDHPAQEGLTQALAVYFDTLLICLIGAVTIIATKSFNVVDGSGHTLVNNLPNVEYGVLYIQNAFIHNIGGFGNVLIAISVWFFCFTSIIAMSYYGEVTMCFMFRNHEKGATIAARLISVGAIFMGGLYYSEFAWNMADFAMGFMVFINLPIILILGKNAFIALKDYERQVNAGVTRLTFEPEKLGIRGTSPGLWDQLNKRHASGSHLSD